MSASKHFRLGRTVGRSAAYLMNGSRRFKPCMFASALALVMVVPASAQEPAEATRQPHAVATDATTPPTDFGKPADLPRPSSMSVNQFEAILFEFVNQRRYVELGWMQDKGVRDTGPFVDGKYYGTHPAVRVFYSPEVMEWLTSDRTSPIPDGAVIIKEQFEPPAARYEGQDESQLVESLGSWTIMVKDSEGSHDGWFWSNPGRDQKVVNYYQYPFEEPYSGFGLYCVRCHASTKSPGETNEYTFASLRNIQGFAGQPLLFRIDDSWRQDEEPDLSNEEAVKAVADAADEKGPAIDLVSTAESVVRDAHPRCVEGDFPIPCVPELNQEFLKFFPQVAQCDRAALLHLPPVTYDSVPRAAGEQASTQQAFVTSNQCMSCHAGITEPFGPSMFIATGDSAGYGDPGIHVSPYGEWRWTPMGLSGRDPVFFAQIESELALLKKRYGEERAHDVGQQLQNTCLGCHGVMGKRQHDLDVSEDQRSNFGIKDVYHQQLDPNAAGFRDGQYAALARDGVSCSVCHRMQPRPMEPGDTREYLEHFLETSITGNFFLGKPGEVYGPYKDQELSPYVMDHAIGMQPKHSDYIKQSQMCGSCHTVNLPIVDWPREDQEDYNDLMLAEWNPEFQDFHHHVEQATYLEWLNSEFENELNPQNPKGQSCQDCHMSKGVHDAETGVDIDQIKTRIAAVQDQTYPDAENLASHEELNVRYRNEYSRHNFRGLNVFMLEMFNQFDDVLGVRKHDYMTGSKTDIAHAVRDFQRQASQDTAKIDVQARWSGRRKLEVDVDIQSLVGHRFPSGVGFRRAFLELLVVDASQPEGEQVVWSSGRTNSVGVLVDHSGNPLETEFFTVDDRGQQQFQPHHEVISDSRQVQIYETLLHDRDGSFTTSFIHGCTVIKDNRFLPRGWTKQGPGGGLKGHFLSATYPGPKASQDARYQDGSGSDSTRYQIDLTPELASALNADEVTVKATLYYQAIPPYFLKNIFDLSPDGPASQRLHYICSNMKLDGTAIEGWKLPVVTASARPSR